jgi:Protein of unknown function (DUF2442)
MADLLDEQIKKARARGREMLKTEPRAVAALYDKDERRVAVDLINGSTYIFPVALAQELNGAADDDLDEVIVDSMGFNLHWPRLDADIYVPALVAGIFGTKRWMEQALARRAGQSKSPAKAAAARENGKKGGRPRKVA